MGEVAEFKGGANIPALLMGKDELIPILRESLYPGAQDSSIALVIDYCKASQLDPMQKPVHIVPMWDKGLGRMRDVIMPGVGLYRTQAARSNQVAGISEPEFGPVVNQNIGGSDISYPEWCKVTVKRRMPTGEIACFTAVERWLENYAVRGGRDRSIAPNAMWQKRPYGQLAKCAQAQALRMGFPEVGAAPTADEMEGKAIDAEYEVVDNSNPPAPEPSAYPAEQFKTNLPAWGKAIQAGNLTAEAVIGKVESKGALTDEQKKAIRDFEVIDAEVSE